MLSFYHEPWSTYFITRFSNNKQRFVQNKFQLSAVDIKNLDLNSRKYYFPLVYHVVDTYVSLSVLLNLVCRVLFTRSGLIHKDYR